MKHDVNLSSGAWFAEHFSLPAIYSDSDADSLLILIDRVTLQICDYALIRKGRRKLALLKLITSAANSFQVPELIFSDLIEPMSVDLFLPEHHTLRFLPPCNAPAGERIRIERLLGDLRKYLVAFAKDDPFPFWPSLNTAMEAFSYDYPVYLSSASQYREDPFHAQA